MTFTIPLWVIAILLIISGAIVGGSFVFSAIGDHAHSAVACIVIFFLLIVFGICLFV